MGEIIMRKRLKRIKISKEIEKSIQEMVLLVKFHFEYCMDRMDYIDGRLKKLEGKNPEQENLFISVSMDESGSMKATCEEINPPKEHTT